MIVTPSRTAQTRTVLTHVNVNRVTKETGKSALKVRNRMSGPHCLSWGWGGCGYMAECLVSIDYIEYCESYNLSYKIVIFNLSNSLLLALYVWGWE